ncbi:glycosyltransferase [Pseudoalteromonas lipolytica]|uniref:Glycosyltransferase n=1 Tax=Pseudoalteromonas lipolytica TaxID=570156 RepID=A0ABU8SV95_9GAMM
MKALCLLSENPCPPRNGITIPTYNQLKILKDLGYDLNIFLIENINEDIKLFGKVKNIELINVSKFNKAMNEIILQRAYYENVFDFKQFSRDELDVDIIYYSPISFGYIANLLSNYIESVTGTKPKIIASISDCYTSVLRTSLSSSKGIALKPFVSYLRSFFISNLESRSLSKADSILVQTNKDKNWLLNIGVKNEKVFVTPNGVSDSLFNLKASNYKDLVFVGNFKSDFYMDKLEWFIKSVFLKLQINYPNCKLHVYTSGFKNERLNKVAQHENVIVHYNFVDDIADVYRDKFVCVAPIFKSYGFINKVAEALGAGLVVVGDKSAFNGMNITTGQEAFIAETDTDFYSIINELLSKKDIFEYVRVQARDYAIQNFSWESRKEILSNATKTR